MDIFVLPLLIHQRFSANLPVSATVSRPLNQQIKVVPALGEIAPNLV